MSKSEINVEISKVIKNLNYLRMNPNLPVELIQELLKRIEELVKELQKAGNGK